MPKAINDITGEVMELRGDKWELTGEVIPNAAQLKGDTGEVQPEASYADIAKRIGGRTVSSGVGAALGGTIGSIAGPVGTVAGAIGGGALGQQVGEALFGESESSIETGLEMGVGALTGGAVGKATGKVIGKGLSALTPSGAVNRVAGQLGMPTSVVDRIKQAQDIHKAYKAAESVDAVVPTQQISAALNEAANTVTDPKAVEILRRFISSDTVGNTPQAHYQDLLKAKQQLMEMSGNVDNLSASVLRDTSRAIGGEMSKVNKAITVADELQSGVTSFDDLVKAVRGGPHKVEELLRQSPFVARRLGLTTPEAIQNVLRASKTGQKGTFLGKAAAVMGVSGTGVGVGFNYFKD